MADTLDFLLEATLADSSITCAQDALLAAIHSTLLAAGYSLVALGDQNFGQDSGSSVVSNSNGSLPSGWNSSQDVYALQYRHDSTKNLCLVKAILLEGQLLVNAMVAGNTAEVITVTLEIAKYVKDCETFNNPSVFRNLLQLMSVLSKELETKLCQICSLPSPAMPPSSERPSAVPRVERDDPLRIGPPRRPHGSADRELDPLGPGPFRYGDADRFPFISGGPGVGGGGMIFDPLRQGGGMSGGFGPRGPFPPSHPHGARYDPVYPFGPGPRLPGRGRGRSYGEPDPDHLTPPGYDDMFS